jgi:hypothetical protein
MNSENVQRIKDNEHLSILSLIYYITGAITMVKSLVFIIHVVIGIVMIAVVGGKEPDARVVGYILIIIGIVALLIVMTIGLLKLLAGYLLKKRRMKVLCIIIAVITCLGIPYGTVQGIFTIIVLVRPSVDELFKAAKGKQLTD